MDTREILWAGGLFEGEGSVMKRRVTGPRRSNHPAIVMSMAMTDEDSVRRFHQAIGGLGVVSGPRTRYRADGKAYKPQWLWSCSGFERCQAVVAMLWTGLGLRRRATARDALLATRVLKKRTDPITGRFCPYLECG